VIYDSVGKDTIDWSLRCQVLAATSCRPGERGGAAARRRLLAARSLLHAAGLARIAAREELVARPAELFDWVRRGAVTVHIDSTFPLAQAADAHRRLESRASTGKILLLP
jgi:NADPH2:quinone reductase